jgi:hypothetical protein
MSHQITHLRAEVNGRLDDPLDHENRLMHQGRRPLSDCASSSSNDRTTGDICRSPLALANGGYREHVSRKLPVHSAADSRRTLPAANRLPPATTCV